jgi:hypothetical protein
MSDQWSSDPLDWVKPRNLGPNPRRPVCKIEDPTPEGNHRPAAMFRPAHPHGPCQVLIEGKVCGCVEGGAR